MANSNNRCSGVIELDPVQGLVDYVNDIKPYHTKVIEVLSEYVYDEVVRVTILENIHMNIATMLPNTPLAPVGCGDGFSVLPYGGPGEWPILAPSQVTPTHGFVDEFTFTIPGDRTGELIPGNQIEITTFIEDYSNLYSILNAVAGPAGFGSFIVDDPLVDFSTNHSVNDVIETVGAVYDDNRSFTITGITSGSPSVGQTTVAVEQSVLSIVPSGQLGMVRSPGNNTGTFTLVSAVYSAGSLGSTPVSGNGPHMTVTVVESLNIPTFTPPDEVYVGSMALIPILIDSVSEPTLVYITGDHRSRFVQGRRFDIDGGSYDGVYTALVSELDGGQTKIYTVEQLSTDDDPPSMGWLKEHTFGYGESAEICDFAFMGVDQETTGLTQTMIAEDLQFGWGAGTDYFWNIIATDVGTSSIQVDGDITGIMDLGDTVYIVGSDGNDGSYEVLSLTLVGTGSPPTAPFVTVVEVSNPDLPTNTTIHGTLHLNDADVTTWFQYIIQEAYYQTGIFTINGNATGDVQPGQQFRVYGNSNAGLYTVKTSPVYDSVTRTTDVPVVVPPAPNGNNIIARENDILEILDDKTIRVDSIITSLIGGDEFVISGTGANDGSYTVVSTTVDVDTTKITVPGTPLVATTGGSIAFNERGGWIESQRYAGINIRLRDIVGVTIGESAVGAVLQTGGNIVDAWDYPYWDVGAFDENLGALIHLYNNTF